jgi:hypothetical protein
MPTIKHKVLGQTISYRILAPLPNGTRPLQMDSQWAAANIINVLIPQLKGVDDGTSGGSSGMIRFHKAGAAQLQAAFNEIEARGLKHLILSFAGSYYPRMIRDSTTSPSEHSFGTALDINAAWNGLAKTPAAKGTKGSVVELVPIFEKWGFRWGGNFSRRDGMHFEMARLIAASTAVAKPAAAAPAPKPRALALYDGKTLRTIESHININNREFVHVGEILNELGFDYKTDTDRTTADRLVLKYWKA